MSLGRGVRDLRGLLLLVPEDERLHVQRAARQGWHFWLTVRRRQPDVLPAALPRPAGMPRRYIDYPDATAGWNHLSSSIGTYIAGVGVLCSSSSCSNVLCPPGRRDNPWGRRRDHAGMDAAFAAAVPPVRDAAEDRTPRAATTERLRERRPSGGGLRAPMFEPEAHGDVTAARHTARTPPTSPERRRLFRALLKPRVMSLVVFTALGGMLVRAGPDASGHRLCGAPRHRHRRRRVGRAEHVVRPRYRRVMSRTRSRMIPRGASPRSRAGAGLSALPCR